MLTADQAAYVEHLLATAAELPTRFPLISAGEFLRQMGNLAGGGTAPVLDEASAEIPDAVPSYSLARPGRPDSSQRWAEHNDRQREDVRSALAALGPCSISTLAEALNLSVAHMYVLARKLKLEKVGDGRYRFPVDEQRLAS